MRSPIPIRRMFDVSLTKRFYVDRLGFALDREEGVGDGPVFMTVQRDDGRIHLSSHHGDGTPGAVVLVPVDAVEGLHAELHAKEYPFMNPGIEPCGIGRELTVLNPASNQLRFFEPRGPLSRLDELFASAAETGEDSMAAIRAERDSR